MEDSSKIVVSVGPREKTAARVLAALVAVGALPPAPDGQKWVRTKVYRKSIAEQIRACQTPDQVREIVSALIVRSPGTASTRRKLHRIAEDRIRSLELARPLVLGPESGRLIATPAEARRENR